MACSVRNVANIIVMRAFRVLQSSDPQIVSLHISFMDIVLKNRNLLSFPLKLELVPQI